MGKNGQGKTNLLEAIALLSRGRSFRTSNSKELIHWEEKEASVFAEVQESQGDFQIGVSFQNGERQLYLHGERVKSISDFIARLLVVTFAPSDIEIVKGPPIERRRFLDAFTTLVFPHTMTHVVNYQRIIRQKNLLLKQGRASSISLEPWNKLLVESARPIIKARRALISRLELLIRDYYSRLACDDGEIRITPKETLPEDDATSYLSLHADNEINSRSVLYGPHRDDMRFLLGGRSARSFSSQGQARTFVLALKIAAIQVIEQERGESPVVLLDDVDAELDRDRRTAFFNAVYSEQRQFVITGTELERDELLVKREHKVIRVERGVLTCADG